MSLYIQYGCGLSSPEGWLNFDSSPRLRSERLPGLRFAISSTVGMLFPSTVRYGDIVSGLPIPRNAAAGVYCSHVLEHLHRDSVVVALKNTFELLQPNGVFRLVVPDLLWRGRRYLAEVEAGKPDAADRFIRSSYMGAERRPTGLMDRARFAFGNSGHRWMYDYGQMTSLLYEAGFIKLRQCKLGDAEDPMFVKVEDCGRFFDGGYPELAMEAKKP